MLPDGYSLCPSSIKIQLTYACNLRCSFCGQWGSSGQLRQLGASELREGLPLGLLKQILDEMPFVCSDIWLWGGEPLLHPDVVPFVQYATGKRKSCEMITNGTLLAKHAAGLMQADLQGVYVSLDGTEEVHDSYRGRGSYRAAIRGIEEVRVKRDRLGREAPSIYASYTMLPENAEELPALAREMKDAGADRIIVNRLTYVTREMGQAYEQTLQTLFQIQAPSWKGFCRTQPLGDPKKVMTLVKEVKRSSELREFVLFPESHRSPNDWCHYYHDPTYAHPSSRRCLFPWNPMCICPNGDVVACPDFPDYVAGNLHHESFSEIWNGEKMRRFRRSLAEHGRFPICSACCHLYV